jgi:demethylmenaquinone methyltransferase/2-methoxy-6-polyprenyl-1,4-benzoquinol methylase
VRNATNQAVGASRKAVCRSPGWNVSSSYDEFAPRFDRDRVLPAGVAAAVRAAVLDAAGVASPSVLDLGAGTGRIGRAFVAVGDDYVGVDRSFGMLSQFGRAAGESRAPHLVQADGEQLPFADGRFDAVMLIQVFGGMRDWKCFMSEVRRVLRPTGALLLGRTIAPENGVDARMKDQLATLLDAMGVPPRAANARAEVERWLVAMAPATSIIAARWTAERSPAQFIARHRAGARFAALPEDVKTEALRRLADWAEEKFGSLDAVTPEIHEFELRIFKFQQGMVA